MLLPLSLLQLTELVLPLSLCAGAALAQHSIFNIKAHGTGYKTASAGALTADNIGVSTSDDLSYTVEITVGGENFVVLLDTGSTDLWVNTEGRNMKLTNTTTLPASITYGKGGIEGNIDFAEVKIGDYVIPSQAFINPDAITDFDTTSFDGILGMAFDVSNVYDMIQRAWGTDAADTLGLAPITSLFAQNPTLPNNFDVQLARTSELEDIAGGTFIISGHALGFDTIESTPKLPRVHTAHWSIVMDAMKVNGESFRFNRSRIAGVPEGKIVAVPDTGFSFPPMPGPAVDAIYSKIPGAMFDPVGSMWIIPCNASTELTFTFAGVDIPVHPIDLSWPLVTQIVVNGRPQNITTCVNAYQYLTLDPTSFVGFDIILGDGFLRNVYASFDYGDYYPANHTNGLPFVQMVSTTNASTMWAEFYAERAAALADLPPEVPPEVVVQYDMEQAAKASSRTASVSGASEVEDGSSGDSWGRKYGTLALALLGANLLVGVALLAVTLTMCVRGGLKGRGAPKYAPVRFKEGGDDHERGALKYSD